MDQLKKERFKENVLNASVKQTVNIVINIYRLSFSPLTLVNWNVFLFLLDLWTKLYKD